MFKRGEKSTDFRPFTTSHETIIAQTTSMILERTGVSEASMQEEPIGQREMENVKANMEFADAAKGGGDMSDELTEVGTKMDEDDDLFAVIDDEIDEEGYLNTDLVDALQLLKTLNPDPTWQKNVSDKRYDTIMSLRNMILVFASHHDLYDAKNDLFAIPLIVDNTTKSSNPKEGFDTETPFHKKCLQDKDETDIDKDDLERGYIRNLHMLVNSKRMSFFTFEKDDRFIKDHERIVNTRNIYTMLHKTSYDHDLLKCDSREKRKRIFKRMEECFYIYNNLPRYHRNIQNNYIGFEPKAMYTNRSTLAEFNQLELHPDLEVNDEKKPELDPVRGPIYTCRGKNDPERIYKFQIAWRESEPEKTKEPPKKANNQRARLAELRKEAVERLKVEIEHEKFLRESEFMISCIDRGDTSSEEFKNLLARQQQRANDFKLVMGTDEFKEVIEARKRKEAVEIAASNQEKMLEEEAQEVKRSKQEEEKKEREKIPFYAPAKPKSQMKEEEK